MNIFVVNSGSSSIKYQVFKMPATEPVCSGLVDRIGLEGSTISYKTNVNGTGQSVSNTLDIPDHEAGLELVSQLLTHRDTGVISNPDEIQVVGHRVVHGGEYFKTTTRITPDLKQQLKSTFHLAPLHNPPAYSGIEVAEKIFKKAAQVAVFDTAFFQSLPPKAYRYAIPNNFYNEHNIRVYGFHGTSHRYVSALAAEYLQKPSGKLITLHLGNGCSMSAVKNGQAVDTTMGFGPLEGLIMGTRSGAIDPTVIFYLVDQLGYDIHQVSNLLNKRSGMLGLTGYSDMRDVTRAMQEGNAEAALAYDLYAYRIKKYIGSYAAVLNGLDAVIFTAGVGENDALIRKLVCADLDYLGIQLDEEKNGSREKGIREINTAASGVKILVVPTNEELEIAKQCYELQK
ncbi:acetate/propionate family kinase [Hufsiella ginkgonis]|uniref:Acetate kinase n=1 Tax=Hufsiella ginkgonis TaxID=2695274 RepID=A0A7K1Y2C4_9SPHI|nr:acetate kinase [Hufsiella ginkgonis]MXV17228.1 acetate/propionate family kinase [Hufsiella ginkgonis]